MNALLTIFLSLHLLWLPSTGTHVTVHRPAVAAHAVRHAVVRPHTARKAIRRPVTAQKPAAAVQTCQTAPDGYVAWYPGQTAPYVLYGDTVNARLVYSSPAGYVTLIKRWTNSDGSTSSATYMEPLSTWCR